MAIREIVLEVALILSVAALARPVAGRLQLPFAVVLAVLGVGLSLAAGAIGAFVPPQANAAAEVTSDIAAFLRDMPVNSDAFLFALLPIMLFQGAVGIDVRHLARDSVAVLMLAILAVLLSVGLIGGALFLVSAQPLLICLMVGAIVATTDPSAVISIFRDLGVPARLTRLVEGESLLNDATAIAIFSALVAAWVSRTEPSVAGISAAIGLGLVGGMALGVAAGFVTARVLEHLRDFRLSQVTLTLALPYLVFLGSSYLPEISGVVAAVAAGLTFSAIGRSRFSREDFRFVSEVLDQVADWATALIFMLAAFLVPRMLSEFQPQDLSFIAVTIVAAFVARGLVLGAVAPVFARARLMQPIDGKMSIALLWGGLRGAMTLALVLAIWEDTAVNSRATSFIAVTACGYALFTLFVQGSTLRILVRALELDRLPAVERAFRLQTLADTMARTKASLLSFTRRAEIDADTVDEVVADYQARFSAAVEPGAFDRVQDREKILLGLRALINQERNLLLDQRWSSGLPSSMLDQHLFALDTMRDEAQISGRLGYLRAARLPHRQSLGFRLANLLHRRLGVNRPLSNALGRRFHYTLIDRVLVVQLRWFAERRLSTLLGERVAGILDDILRRRLEDLEREIEVVRLQYPDFAREMERAMIERIAFYEEINQIEAVVEAGIIGEEIGRSLIAEAREVHSGRRRTGAIDLTQPKPQLLRSMRAFEALPDDRLDAAAQRLSPVVFPAGARIYGPESSVDSIYFIASGAVEVRRGDEVSRLGRGQAFGQLRVLNPDLKTAEVTALTYTHCFRMSASDFRELLGGQPAWSEAMRSPDVAASPILARASAGPVPQRVSAPSVASLPASLPTQVEDPEKGAPDPRPDPAHDPDDDTGPADPEPAEPKPAVADGGPEKSPKKTPDKSRSA